MAKGNCDKYDLSQFTSILEEGYTIEIKPTLKRTESKMTGIRDFYIRFIWKITAGTANYESEWEGFDTADECVSDLINKFEGTIKRF